MLYDGRLAKKKLQKSIRGPLKVIGFAGCHGKFYKLGQLNGKSIPLSFYGDHLKSFKPRSRHLITRIKNQLPHYQNIRSNQHTLHLQKFAKERETNYTYMPKNNDAKFDNEDSLDIFPTANRW